MTGTVCSVCKAPGVCPVEDGVTFHRQYPPPPGPGWRPTPGEVEAAVSTAEAKARLAATEAYLDEMEAKRPTMDWDELVAVVDDLRGQFD